MKTIFGASTVIMMCYAAPLVLVILLGLASLRACIWENIRSRFTTMAAPQPREDKSKYGKMTPEEREAVIADLKRIKRTPQLLSRR